MARRLRTERVNDGVVCVGFNNPDKRNALDEQTVTELDDVLSAHSSTPTVLILYSTTASMFVSGADIRELRSRRADDALRAINAGLFDRLARHRWPTIAAIDGYALGGGCELALACDFRIATPESIFAQPELGLGIMAGAGANWRLRELVGLGTARRMLFLGERISGDEAHRLGLVDEISASETLLKDAISMADRISHNSWRATELTKLALGQQRLATTSFDLAAQALLFDGDEKAERMDQFLNRKTST